MLTREVAYEVCPIFIALLATKPVVFDLPAPEIRGD